MKNSTDENPAQIVIRKCGGPKVVSDWTGLDVSRIYRWTYPKARGGTGGIVPAEHQPTILKKALADGKDLKPEDFFPSDVFLLQAGEAS